MNDNSPTPPAPAHHRRTVACVSFLNSKPLVEPLLDHPDVHIHFAVPSALLDLMETGAADAGLLSIVDYQLSAIDLILVPAGAIGSDGRTYTVRIFSKVPPAQITRLFGDTDSHTSLILAQLIMRERYGISPPLLPLGKTEAGPNASHDAVVLIGDKVVNAAPDAHEYPHQLDLGEEWKHLTGLPFVFACWMMPAHRTNQDLADLLGWAQRVGADMTEALVAKYAAVKGWPPELARKYFTEYLQYEVTDDGRRGIEKFFALAAKHGLLALPRAVRYLELSEVK